MGLMSSIGTSKSEFCPVSTAVAWSDGCRPTTHSRNAGLFRTARSTGADTVDQTWARGQSASLVARSFYLPSSSGKSGELYVGLGVRFGSVRPVFDQICP